MKILETHGHMDRNFVKVGDRVKAYKTVIGTIGTGNGQYPAHDHASFSQGLTPAQIKHYIRYWNGKKMVWPKKMVKKYYLNPHKIGIDWAKMYSIPVNIGVSGYDFTQKIKGGGYHPGVDINGNGGGNTDKGTKIKAAHDGTVIFEQRTWFKNGGWGNIIIIEWDAPILAEPPIPPAPQENKYKMAISQIEKIIKQLN